MRGATLLREGTAVLKATEAGMVVRAAVTAAKEEVIGMTPTSPALMSSRCPPSCNDCGVLQLL